MREGVAYKTGFNSIKLFKNRQPRKLVAVAYSWWSFTRGSNCKKKIGVCVGGCLEEVTTHGSSIVLATRCQLAIKSWGWPNQSETVKYCTCIAWYCFVLKSSYRNPVISLPGGLFKNPSEWPR